MVASNELKKKKRGLSIRSKFLLMLLGISVFSIAIIGFQGLYNGHKSLTDGIKQQLSILRSSRAKDLENYFQNRRNQVSTLADSTMIIDAMEEFSSAYSLLESYDIKLEEEQQSLLEHYYKDYFFPSLRKESNTTQSYDVDDYIPRSSTGKYLQYQYIANNPEKQGEKDLLNFADDKSYYSKIHQKYHPKLRKFIKTFDYYDVFLIDKDSKNVIYSAYKETDFSSNLKRDIQAQSNLAQLVDKVIKTPTKGHVYIVDIEPYISSYNAPAAFFATAIYNKNQFIGVLALQISIKQITTIMDANKSWRKSGLGETGEVYLVGSDYKMRSNSRFLYEKKIDYIKTLYQLKLDEKIIDRIAQSNRTVLLQPVNTEASRAALKGDTGIKEIKNYKEHDVLSAYQPLKIDGLDWAIIAEIDKKEATQPVVHFQKMLLISAAIQAAFISFFSLWLAGHFIGPIKALIAGAKRANDGDTKTHIDLKRHDELGELADSFNDMIANIQKQKQIIVEKDKTINKLLLNVFPPDIAKRYMKGEKNIANSSPNVAVLYTALKGLDESVSELTASQAVERLNQIVDAFDEAAITYDIERITTVGDSYLAACGLSNPRLDYACRCVEYGHALFEIIDRFNIQYGTKYKLRIGISSGDISAGVVGSQKSVYDLWGDTINIASRIRYTAELGGMRISQSVYTQLTNPSGFEKKQLINMRGVGDIATWEYKHKPITHKTTTDNTEKE
ncbi:MAG: adenylate/guanylate cyclase domain-containing protein [Aquificaceae bacterium]|nr:MAG: adenylate/guanylate cyclase domain-containing protein [Aquificaceae bacterium]